MGSAGPRRNSTHNLNARIHKCRSGREAHAEVVSTHLLGDGQVLAPHDLEHQAVHVARVKRMLQAHHFCAGGVGINQGLCAHGMVLHATQAWLE